MGGNKLNRMNLVVCFALAAAAGACEGPTNTTVADADLLELDADVVNYGMTSFLSSTGIREARIQADTAYIYADSAKAYLRQMELIIYQEDGRARATVTALRGELDTNTDAMLAQGDVVLTVHEDGRIIQTSELHYDPQRDRIWSDSATTQIMADGRVTEGTAFESDMEFRNIDIANPRGDIGQIIF